ncbi:MAG: hypothetical protein ACRD04_14085, partial [Terriglobales bacterium]
MKSAAKLGLAVALAAVAPAAQAPLTLYGGVARPALAGAAPPVIGLWPGRDSAQWSPAPRQQAPAGAQDASELPRWAVQSSAKVTAAPASISQPGYSTQGWLPVSVPSTVFNAEVVNHLVPNP